MFMGGKRTRTARVPCHRRFATRLRPSTATGSERKITSPNTCVSGVSMTSAIAKCGSRQLRPKASCMDAICRASSSVSAATTATCRLERLRSLSVAGVSRNSVRVSRTSTVRSGTQVCLPRRPLVCGPQPAHGEIQWRPPAARAIVRLRSYRQPSDTPSERP
jgi:hypothetical protein